MAQPGRRPLGRLPSRRGAEAGGSGVTMTITPQQLKAWLSEPAPESDLAGQIRRSATTPQILEILRHAAPDLTTIAPTTYTLYREFERSGARASFQQVYFARRSQLTRAVLETLLGD